MFNETLPQPVSASVVEAYIGGDHLGVPQWKGYKVKWTQGGLETDQTNLGNGKININYKVYKT